MVITRSKSTFITIEELSMFKAGEKAVGDFCYICIIPA